MGCSFVLEVELTWLFGNSNRFLVQLEVLGLIKTFQLEDLKASSIANGWPAAASGSLNTLLWDS